MAVIRLDVAARPFGDGQEYGAGGAYEELVGVAHIGLDPAHPRNAAITDIGLAPTGYDGRVHVTADVSILRPVDQSKSNRRIFLDVVNRGTPIMMRLTDTNPFGEASSGWLLQQGYTVVRCGWQHDVPRSPGVYGVEVPDALQDGEPMTGLISSLHTMESHEQVVILSDRGHRPYPVADLEDPTALMTVREHVAAEPKVIDRAHWSFARLEDGKVVPDANHVYYADGFLPGHVYEITYTALGAPLTAAGLAASRDVVSFLRFASEVEGNPCAGQIDFALASGASQTGRFLRQMLYLGLCEDESERLVFDGLLPHIAGGRLIESGWRFGQPSYVGPLSVANQFPYNDAVQVDPLTGVEDGLLRAAEHRGKVPKVMHVNTSCEYWGSQAALIHLTPDCSADADIPDNVRIYLLSGTQHISVGLPLANVAPEKGKGAYHLNTIDYRPLLRSLVTALDAWATRGVEPPASEYPRLDNGSLVRREAVRKHIAAHLPGKGIPEHCPPVLRLDFGPDALTDHVATVLPPKVLQRLPGYAPDVDDDGNELAGIHHPDVSVPLATYTGWNPRHDSIGGTDQLLRSNGATIPFARDIVEAEEKSDLRQSIEARYGDKDDYLAKVREAAVALVGQRFLLTEDVDRIVAYSAVRWEEFTGR